MLARVRLSLWCKLGMDGVWVLGKGWSMLWGLYPLTVSWHCSEMFVIRLRAPLRTLKEKQRNSIACLLLVGKSLSAVHSASGFLTARLAFCSLAGPAEGV